MKSVKIVIPIYRERLPELEVALLRHNLKVLENHEVVLIVPDKMDISQMRDQFNIDDYQIIRISREWIGTDIGVAGYNKMMMSAEFYSMFNDVDYILICQTDVYIFRDELEQWVERGYDYIGAPWIAKAYYNNFLIRSYLKLRLMLRSMLRSKLHRKSSTFLRQELFGRVGNGGLSLRNVARCQHACEVYSDRIEALLASRHHLNNEDVFWALVPEDFVYPTCAEALNFSIDTKPYIALKMAGNRLPFGCHGLTKPNIYRFWRDKIEV